MAGWIPPRLRSLLGAEFAELDSDGLNALVGLEEDTDLEFKAQPYETTDAGRKEAAYDVAGIASAVGGLLIFGISEDGNGRAVSIDGFMATPHDFPHWIDQVVADRVRPRPTIAQRSIAVGGGLIHVVSVSPSTLAPFAVSTGDGAVRFPLRTGRTRIWQSEADISDRYRRRFVDSQLQDELLDQVQRWATALVNSTETRPAPWSWLAVSLVPSLPGALELQRGITESWHAWLQPALRSFPTYGRADIRD